MNVAFVVTKPIGLCIVLSSSPARLHTQAYRSLRCGRKASSTALQPISYYMGLVDLLAYHVIVTTTSKVLWIAALLAVRCVLAWRRSDSADKQMDVAEFGTSAIEIQINKCTCAATNQKLNFYLLVGYSLIMRQF